MEWSEILKLAGMIVTLGSAAAGACIWLYKAGQGEAMRRNGYVTDARFKDALALFVTRDSCHGHVTQMEGDLKDVKEAQVRMFTRIEETMRGIARIEGKLGV